MDLHETMNDVYVKEEIKVSNHPLTEHNDIASQSDANLYRPKVWAQTRQELCESLNYFRTYQSGVYHKNNVVYSYLMDAFGAKRDVCNGRVIISHGGGKSSKQNDGNYGLFESQLTTDASVSSLLNNYIDQQPVVIIVGNKCSIVNFNVPARYCVLGVYLITHAWPEYEVTNGSGKDTDLNLNRDCTLEDLTDEEIIIDDTSPESSESETKNHKSIVKHFVRWKFRFEWMTNQEFEPWWESPDEITSFSDTLDCGLCHLCKRSSFWIYEIWMCLNHSCKLFWQVWNPKSESWEMAPQELTFKKSFLNPGFISKELLTRPLPFSIVPPPVPSAELRFGAYTSLHWKGYHCRRCGRLSCRVNWSGWECFNCHKIQPAPKMVVDKSMLVDPYRLIFTGPPTDCDGSILVGSGIIRERKVLSNGTILMDYKFPEGGHVYHYVSNKNSNAIPDLFLREFQEIDCPHLKRHSVKRAVNRVGSNLYSRQFTLNIGANYKQALDLNTLSWPDAPKVCKNVFTYMRNIVRGFIPNADFNEMLSAVYMEGQRMSWHDDGEKGIGPVIAALSLGSDAEMKFRRKPRKNESKLTNETEPTDINNVENTSLETIERANKKTKLMNNEDSCQNNQDNSNANRNNVSKKRGRKKFSQRAASSTSKVAGSMKFQLPSLRNLSTPDTDTLPGFSSVVSEHMCRFSPIDISKICIRKRTIGPALSLDIHHGDLVIMKGKVLQDNYDHMVVPKGFRIVATIRQIQV